MKESHGSKNTRQPGKHVNGEIAVNRKFHESRLRTFFIEHVEKLLFGLAATIAIVLCWTGIHTSRTARISSPETPAMLLEQAREAEQHVDGFTWDDFKDLPERDARAEYQSRIDEARQEINPSRYRSPNVLSPPYMPPRQKRQDPKLFPVTHLQARGGFSTAQRRIARTEAADNVLEDTTIPKETQTDRPIPGVNRNGDTRRVSRTSAGGKPRGVFFVSVTGLIPFRQQVEEYNRCFQRPVGYNPKRDTPKYLDFRLYRAEAQSGKEPEFKFIASRRTVSKVLKKWIAKQSGTRFESQPLIAADAMSTMTMPLLSFDLQRDRLDHLMRHPTIGKFALPERSASQTVPEENEQIDNDDPFFDSNDRRPRSEYVREDQYNREQISTTVEPPEFKMFRYIDLDVTPGKTYLYKVVFRMEDPNDPDLRESVAPDVSTLELEVKKRVVAKNEENFEKFRLRVPSAKNYFLRESPFSATSVPVKVTDGRRIILGSVRTPRLKKGRLPKPGDEPRAEMMALEFDRENATDVPATFRAYRGTIGNFSKEVEIPIWHEQVLRKFTPKDANKPGPYTFRTNMAVMDIDGGRVLDQEDREKLRTVAEVLVWKDGKMSVLSDLDSREEFNKFTFAAEEK